MAQIEQHEREPVNPILGPVLRRYRRRAQLTQERLAERAGVSARTIRALEGGRVGMPRVESLRLLGDALDLSDAERRELLADQAEAGQSEEPRAAPPAQLPAAAVHAEAGRPARAHDAWDQAQTIFRELGAPETDDAAPHPVRASPPARSLLR